MAKAILLESMILPPISVVHTIVRHSGFILEACENYQKRSFRNRIYLAGSNGIELFSLPLAKGKNEKQKITEVVLAYDEPWHLNLIKLIKTCYGSAPFFEFLIDDITHILGKKHRYLFDLSLDFHSLIQDFVDPYDLLGLTDSFLPVNHAHESFIDYRNHFRPNNPDQLSRKLPVYEQVFSDQNGFIPDLSILDLMMCMGRESIIYLQRSIAM